MDFQLYAARTRFFNDALIHDSGPDSRHSGWIYVIEAATQPLPVFKIGLTVQTDPFQRLRYLPRQVPFDHSGVSVWGVAKTSNPRRHERILHKTFGDRHVLNEWFRLTDTDKEWLALTMEFARTDTEYEGLLLS